MMRPSAIRLRLLALLLAASACGCEGRGAKTISAGPADPCTPEDGSFAPVYPVHHERPSWSSKGLIAYEDRGIVCVSPNGGYAPDTSLAGLWILDPFAGTKHRVRSTGYTPAWSPEGDMLAFFDHGQVFVMRSDGSNQRQLTTQGANFYPEWHPDGKRVTFNSNSLGASSSFSTWIVDLDGSNPHQLCPHQVQLDEKVSWHPAGAKYVHTKYSMESEIFESDTTACIERQLTANSYLAMDPAYSPSGNQIAFTRWVDTYPPQIWLMNATGTDQRQLTRNGGRWPTWSPDGRQIAFVRTDARMRCPEQGVLWIVDIPFGPHIAERQLTYRWPSQCVENAANVAGNSKPH